ncbi:MAG TPA: accessory factor UbiK family protein [Patescibacteria group bacterium]|nr:accessory factor UbiK family protein [Patescibacteria group bacterium]
MRSFSSDKKMLDDIARVAGGAVNIISGLRQQVRDDMRLRAEEVAARLDLVPREDFDELRARVEKLEAALGGKAKKSAARPAKTAKRKKR